MEDRLNEKIAAQGFSREVAGPVLSAGLAVQDGQPAVFNCCAEAQCVEGGNGVGLTHFRGRGVGRFVGKNPEGERYIEPGESARSHADRAVCLSELCRAVRRLNGTCQSEGCIRSP